MNIEVSLAEGMKVNATVGKHIVKTDQKTYGGGEDSAPAPFDYFLASLATCAGIFVKVFCERRGIDSTQVSLVQKHDVDPLSHKIKGINLEILLPADFPEKYKDAVIAAADQCSVKKLIADPPEISVRALTVQEYQ